MRTAEATTLADILHANAAARPNATAFVHNGRSSSFKQYYERAGRFADALRRRGVRRQDRVAILSLNRIEFCEVCDGCTLGGYITVTINFRLSGPEITYILNDSEPRVLVYDTEHRDVVRQIKPALRTVTHFVEIGGPLTDDEDYESVLVSAQDMCCCDESLPEDIAYLIYTSGTTGRPKGCILGQAETLRRTRMMSELIAANERDRILLTMPLFHIGAKMFQLALSYAGGGVHIHSRFDPVQVIQEIARSRITIGHLAPTMIQDLLAGPIDQHDLSSLRLMIYSAAPMPPAVLRQGLAKLGQIFLQGFGQTEGGGTCLQPRDHIVDGDSAVQRRLLSVGLPYPGTELRIVDQDDNDVPSGAAGEILLRSNYNMRGYWNNSPASIDALRGGWLHTGDVGRLDEDGYLYLLDRKKDMIVSGGENIYCVEVENALASMAAVREVAVFGLPNAKWGEAVCAAVVLRPGAHASSGDVISHCRSLIASYKKPQKVYFVDALPRLNTGKVDKAQLRALFASNSEDRGTSDRRS